MKLSLLLLITYLTTIIHTLIYLNKLNTQEKYLSSKMKRTHDSTAIASKRYMLTEERLDESDDGETDFTSKQRKLPASSIVYNVLVISEEKPVGFEQLLWKQIDPTTWSTQVSSDLLEMLKTSPNVQRVEVL